MNKYSRDNFRQAVEPLKPSPSGSVAPFTSFYYLDYARLVRAVRFDTQHTVVDGELGRIELIAFRYYNDINLWWFVAYSNGIVNPFKDMYVGQVLRIASLASLSDALRRARTTVNRSSVTLP